MKVQRLKDGRLRDAATGRVLKDAGDYSFGKSPLVAGKDLGYYEEFSDKPKGGSYFYYILSEKGKPKKKSKIFTSSINLHNEINSLRRKLYKSNK